MEEILTILEGIEGLLICLLIICILIFVFIFCIIYFDDKLEKDNYSELRKELESKKLQYAELKIQYEGLKYLFTKIDNKTNKKK